MNKINYFFGYLLFRMRNRWKSKKNIVVPESYSEPAFIAIIFFPLMNFFFLFEKISNYFVDQKKYYIIFILICFFIPNFYTDFLNKYLKNNPEIFINHKWNKLPIAKYMYYFIVTNFAILGMIIRAL